MSFFGRLLRASKDPEDRFTFTCWCGYRADGQTTTEVVVAATQHLDTTCPNRSAA